MNDKLSSPSENPDADPSITEFVRSATSLMTMAELAPFKLDDSIDDQIAIYRFAQQDPDRFKDSLVELALSYQFKGEKLMSFSPGGTLVVDTQGDLVVITGNQLSGTFDALGDKIFDRKFRYTYQFITGPFKGEEYSSSDRPLALFHSLDSGASA